MTRPSTETGSSLIETLISLSILAGALVFILGAMGAFSIINGKNQVRSNAATAARTRAEELRFVDPATLPSSGTQTTSTSVGQHSFTIITRYCANTSYCDANTRHVVLTVQEQGRNVFETETVLTQLR